MRAVVVLALLSACQETQLNPLSDGSDRPVVEDPVPMLQVEPRQIAFEPLAAGDSAEATFTVTNVGDGQLQLIDVSIVDGVGSFALHTYVDAPLGAGESATWSVIYEPETHSTLEDKAIVRVTSDAPVDGEALVTVTGNTLLPRFELDPVEHDFGVVTIGGRPARDIVVRNVGEARGSVTGAEFSATSEELIWYDPEVFADGPILLGAGEELPLKIRYAPLDDLRDEGTLVVHTDAPATPELSASVGGVGEPEITGPFEVELVLTVDDAWTGYLDGAPISGSGMSDWRATDTLAATLMGGDHVVAIKGQDNHAVISGLIAMLRVDGAVVSVTGSGDWKMASTNPGSGWEAIAYDDSAWTTAVRCSDQSVWGTYYTKDLDAEGARWIWWSSNCRNLKEAWFRYEFTL